MRLSPDDTWADMISYKFLYLKTQSVNSKRYVDKIHPSLILMNITKILRYLPYTSFYTLAAHYLLALLSRLDEKYP